MRKSRQWVSFLTTLVMLLICVMSSALAGESVQVTVKADFKYSEARKMLDLINKFRTGSDAWYLAEDNTTRIEVKGLSKLSYDYDLERTAMQRAVELAAYFSHTRPNGSAWSSAFPSGVGTKGENVAYGYGSVEAAFKGFAEEDKNYAGQGHRRNMLRKEFTRVGFGAVRVGNVMYWAQAFGGGKAGGSDSNLFKSSQVNASCDLLIKNSKGGISTDVEIVTLSVRESANAPSAVIYSNTGAQLKLENSSWKAADSVVTVKGNKIVGASEGKTKLQTKVGGKTVSLPVSVVGSAKASHHEEMENDISELIDDYDPALAADDLIIVLEDDECFEME